MRRRKILVISMLMMFFGMIGILTACGSSSDESSSVEAPTKTSENPQTPTGTKTSDPTSQPTNPTTSPSPGTTSSGSPTTTTSESPRTTTEVPAQKVLSSISATYSGGELNVGESVNKTDITVMARYSDSTEATVTNFTVGTYQNTQAGNVTITISYTEGDVTKTTNISVSFVVPTPVVEEYEFFYYNSENWDQVKIYAYTDSYKYAGDWPGTLMTAVSGHTGWYSAKVNKEAAVVIFNNGLSGENARQTENLTVDATKLYFNGQWGSDFSVEPPVEEKNVFYFYNKDSWASVYVYAYKQTADEAAYTYTANWPGDAMVALSGHDGWFSAEVNKKANAVIFNNGLSGNDERKTENLTVDATKLYFNESWQADFGTDVVLPNYVAKVNGEPKEVTEKAKGDNNYVFEISLTEGQILTVFKDNEALSFPQNEGEDELSSYTAAESADYTVYVNHNNKVYVSKNVVVENITVHYYNQENWDNVKVHYWGDGVDATTWPGISMTAETDHDGWFSVQIPGNVEKVVFNDGGENKTPDIALEENKLYYNGQWGADYSVLPPQVEYLTIYFYNKDNYEEVYLYSWLQDGDYTHEYSGEYPGTKMTAEKGHDGWFSLEVNALANRVIFNDGNNKKTQDLTVDKDKLYHNNGWQKGFEKEQEVSSYVVKVDKKVVEVTEKDKGNNNYVFEVELEKGAVIVVEKENEALVVKGVDSKEVTEAKSFTSSRAGIHKFFVNENNEIYILQPEIEAGTYVVKKGADEIQVEPFEKEDSGDNHLVFELELEKDDVVTILRDDNKLSFPQKQDEAPKDSFTAVRSGKHTFYVNSSDDVYVVSPQAEVEKINLYFYNSDDWKNVLVHYWGGENATDWPGVKMMAVEEHEGWFSVEMPNTEEHVLFHSGDGVQTSDLNINATKLYYKDGWQEDFEVVEPTLVVKVNDEAVEKLGKAEKSAADLFAFTLDLDIDDVVSITVGDKVVLQPEANEPFKATIKGTHTFYINKINELYVVEPEKPEATYTVELNEVVAKVTDLKIEGNVLSFELKLEIDDEVVIKADDKALAFKEFEDAKKFVAEASGKHTFYVNLEDEVYVTLPVVEKGVYKVTLNDEEKEVVDLKIDDNNLSFKITLAKGDKVVITSDDVALKFVEYDQAKSFTAGWAGAYEFYVNSNNAVYVVAPEKPEGVISVLLNDEAVENVKDLKVEGNKLAFELTLAKNDKVVILLDEEELKLPEHKNAKVFVAEVAGKHTFYVNLEYEVYVTEPVEIEDDAVIQIQM